MSWKMRIQIVYQYPTLSNVILYLFSDRIAYSMFESPFLFFIPSLSLPYLPPWQLLEIINRSLSDPEDMQGIVVANDSDTDRAYMLGKTQKNHQNKSSDGINEYQFIIWLKYCTYTCCDIDANSPVKLEDYLLSRFSGNHVI